MTQLCFSRYFLLALACSIAFLAVWLDLQSLMVAAPCAFGAGWFSALQYQSGLKLWWHK